MNLGKKIATLLLCASLSTASVNALVGPRMVPGPEAFAGVAILSLAAGAATGYALSNGNLEEATKTLGRATGKGLTFLQENSAQCVAAVVAGIVCAMGYDLIARKIRDYYKQTSTDTHKVDVEYQELITNKETNI